LNALLLLPQLDNIELDHTVEKLLEHPTPEVRVAALEYYARRQTMRFANSVFRRFEDKDPSVRAAAIDAFCAIGRDKAVRSVRPFLQDSDPRIRSAAVTGMIRYGGLDGVLVAAEALKGLIDNHEPVMREHAARVLGQIGVKNFYQPVLSLMNDPDPRVRRQAITAAGVLKSPEFVIPLIYRTQSIETMREAVAALTQYGATIIPTLAKVLDNSMEDSGIRRAVSRVLGRLGTPEAVRLIAQHLDEPDEELRARLYRALARAVKGRRLLLDDKKPVEQALQRELHRAYVALAQAEILDLHTVPGPDTPRRGEAAARALLASALQEKVAWTERCIFLLLAVLYPDADMDLRRHSRRGRRRRRPPPRQRRRAARQPARARPEEEVLAVARRAAARGAAQAGARTVRAAGDQQTGHAARALYRPDRLGARLRAVDVGPAGNPRAGSAGSDEHRGERLEPGGARDLAGDARGGCARTRRRDRRDPPARRGGGGAPAGGADFLAQGANDRLCRCFLSRSAGSRTSLAPLPFSRSAARLRRASLFARQAREPPSLLCSVLAKGAAA
jgi:HEAT repeat protein